MSPRSLTESDSDLREKTTFFSSSFPLLETIILALSIIPARSISVSFFVVLEVIVSVLVLVLLVSKIFLASSILKTDSGGFGDIINPTEVSKFFLLP